MTTTTPPPDPSALLDYLPALYRQHDYLGQFLIAFEKVLLGRDDGAALPALGSEVGFPDRGLEQTVDRLWTYFDPRQAPREFLPWLAGWVALSLRADLSEAQQRDFVAHAIRLYRQRGTAGNMAELLRIFTSQEPVVLEDLDKPHRFRVEITLATRDKDVIARQQAIAHALIVLEKPAHTQYDLVLYFPSLEIGACRINETTLLSSIRASEGDRP